MVVVRWTSRALVVREIPPSPGGTSNQSQPPRLDSVLNTLLERRARPDIGNLSTECAAFWRNQLAEGFGSEAFQKKRGTGIKPSISIFATALGKVYFLFDRMGLSV